MTIEATIADAKTGMIKRYLILPSVEDLIANYNPATEIIIEGIFDPAKYYVRNSNLVEYPASPGEWARFNYNTHVWDDPRSPRDLVAERIAARQAATVGRAIFAKGLFDLGKLSAAEALEAARGEIPIPLQALDFDSQLQFAGSSVFQRQSDLMLKIQGVLTITPGQMDNIFGIEIYT